MRLEKKAISNEIRLWLTQASFVILTDYRGMNVGQMENLRKRLAKLESQMHVVPNRLCKRVITELNWGKTDLSSRSGEAKADEAFLGPTAMVTGQGDVMEVAKVLKGFHEEHRLPVIKFGFFDGRFFSAPDFDMLVKLPSKEILFSMLVGTVAAPMSRLAGVLKQKVASLLYVLKAVQAKKSPLQ